MDVVTKNKPPDKDSVKMIPDDRSDLQTRSSMPYSKRADNSLPNYYPARASSASSGGLKSHYAPANDSNLQRGLSRSMDVIINLTPREKSSVLSNVSADTNNNSKRLENLRRKFSCPEIAAILDKYIPKEELSEPQAIAMPSPMRRSRSLNELPGSVRVPILKRTETERMKARLEASIAGTEELNKLRENQEKLMAETRTSVTTRKNQNRRQSNPTRLSSSHLTRIFEEENGQEDSDQEVFYEDQSGDRSYRGARTPRRTQSYRDSNTPSYSSKNTRPHLNTNRRYSDSIDVPRTLNDSAQSWSELTQRAESFSGTPAKRNIRSNSMFVGNSTSGNSPSLLSQAETTPTSTIDLKWRRSSMQSDAILTGWNRTNKSASIFENMDIKSTSPNPIRAVLMQYEVSKRTIPLNIKRSPTKPAPMKAFKNDLNEVAVSGNVLTSDSSSDDRSDSQSRTSSQSSSVSQNTSVQTIPNCNGMGSVLCELGDVESGIDHQSKISPNTNNDCDKPCGPTSQNHPYFNAVVNNRTDWPKPSSSTPVGTPKHLKYNSIASDDSLFTPSSYSSFCSSNLSSASFNSTAKLPCVSIDEGFIESPPLSPDHAQSFYSFHETPDKTHSNKAVSDTPVSLKTSDNVTQKQKVKEIPSNSRTQTEV